MVQLTHNLVHMYNKPLYLWLCILAKACYKLFYYFHNFFLYSITHPNLHGGPTVDLSLAARIAIFKMPMS